MLVSIAKAFARPLTFLRTNPAQDVLFRDIIGENAPRALIVRTKDEFVDKGMFELGSAASFFGGGYLLNSVFNKLLPAASSLTKHQQQWMNLGRTFGIMGPIATALIALPFFRNYMTTKRTGKMDYSDVIGEKACAKHHNANEVQHAIQHHWDNTKKVSLIGLGLSAALSAACLLMFKKKVPFSPTAKAISNWVGLKGGQFKHLADHLSFLWWSVPTFIGLFGASRDKNELFENGVHFLAFNASFFVMPNLMKKWASNMAFLKHLPHTTQENTKYLIKFLTSTALCAVLPNAANIWLTHRRAKHEAAHAQAKPSGDSTGPSLGLGQSEIHMPSAMTSLPQAPASAPAIQTSFVPPGFPPVTTPMATALPPQPSLGFVPANAMAYWKAPTTNPYITPS